MTVSVNGQFRIYADKVARLDRARLQALAQTADVLITDIRRDQTMPFKEGTLQNDSTFLDDSAVSSGKASIVSSTPYARRLYFHPEYNFSRAHNPHAGGKWWEPYLTGDKSNRAAEIYGELFKRLGGL